MRAMRGEKFGWGRDVDDLVVGELGVRGAAGELAEGFFFLFFSLVGSGVVVVGVIPWMRERTARVVTRGRGRSMQGCRREERV